MLPTGIAWLGLIVVLILSRDALAQPPPRGAGLPSSELFPLLNPRRAH